jgi:hypothetical protein
MWDSKNAQGEANFFKNKMLQIKEMVLPTQRLL